MTPGGRSISLETVLYAVVFALGVFLRFYELDWPPLDNFEAIQALAAAGPTPSASSFSITDATTSSPGYANPTSLLFALLGASDINARTIPALAGSAIILLPILLRQKFGRSASLLISSLIAISPIMIVTSRTASGVSMAMLGISGALVVALASSSEELSKRRGAWSGVFLGLGLSGGSAAIMGLAGVALARLLAGIPRLRFTLGPFPKAVHASLVRLGASAIVVSVAISTGLGLLLQSLPGLIEGVGTWLVGWTEFGGWPSTSAILSLVAYDPLILVFGVIGGGISFRERDSLGAGAFIWALAALVIAILYPSRNSLALAWVVLPLTVSAGRGIAYLVGKVNLSKRWWNWALMAALLVILASYMYLQLSSFANRPQLTEIETTLTLGSILGALALAAAVLILFGIGWSWREAATAGLIALTIVLLGFSISAGWRLIAGETADSAREILRSEVSTREIVLLRQSIQSISQARQGRKDSIEIQAFDPLSPSLVWALREFDQYDSLDEGESLPPPIVLARSGEAVVNLRAEYIGQTFTTSERWGWQGGVPPSLVTWWVSRSAPTLPEKWLLLVRSDLGRIDISGEGSVEGEGPIE